MTRTPPPRGGLASTIALIVLAIAVIVTAVVLLVARPPSVQVVIQPPPTGTPIPPTVTPAPIVVYVSGAVMQPGLITLPPASRVSDAIAQAVSAPDADLRLINLAAPLRDGDQVDVPRMGEAPVVAPPRVSAGDGAADRIAVNSATAAELETLPGIGPALAGRIIAYRETVGRIDSLETLDRIEGIGPSVLGQIQDRVRFD